MAEQESVLSFHQRWKGNRKKTLPLWVARELTAGQKNAYETNIVCDRSNVWSKTQNTSNRVNLLNQKEDE